MAFDVGAIVARLELDKKKWEQSIAAVKKDQTSLQGFVLRNEQQIKSLGRTLTVGGALVTGFFGLIMKGAINAGDYINDLSKRTGVGTETLSAYKLAADKSGTSLEGLAIGMRGLANQMQAANAGSKEGKRLFDALGVAYVDNTGKLRPLDQVMLDVADRFAQMEDGAQKTALAQDIFGRSGMELIPMLNMGRKGLEENAAAARKLGIVWSTEAARKADEFNDSLVELNAGLAGTGRKIAIALMPTVKSLIERVRDIAVKVREWIAEHPALTSWITKLALGAGLLAGALGPILMMLPGLIKGFQAIQVSTIATTFGGITFAVMGAYAAFKLLIALRDDWERKTGHFVDKETKAWTKITYAIGGWSSFAEAAVRQNIGSMSELTAIWDKYGQNTTDTLKAIAKGDEGKALQKFLEELAGKHLEVAIAAGKQKETYDGLVPSVKSLAEELGIMTRVKVEEKLDKMRQALVQYKGQLTIDEEKKLREEIEKLEKQLDPDTVRAFGNLAMAGEKAADDLVFTWEWAWKEFSTSSDEATLKTAEDMIANFKWGGDKIAEGMKETTAETANYFDGLYNDIAQGWANTIEQWMSGATTFKDFMKSLWEDVKSSFFRVIGEMAAKFAIDLIKSLISNVVKAATATTGALASIGTAIGGIGAGIAGLITALATAIAAAATTLAAAAPAIAIVAALGLAIYAGFSIIKGLMDKWFGGGGKSSDVTYWLKLIWENTTNLLNWTIGGITAQLETFVKAPMVEKFDALKASLDLTRDQMIPRLDKIVEYTSLLKKIQFGQHGLDTTVSRPTMFMAGERGPERVTISPNFRISSTPIHVHVHMDGKQIALVTAKYAPELSRDGALKIHERGLIRN